MDSYPSPRSRCSHELRTVLRTVARSYVWKCRMMTPLLYVSGTASLQEVGICQPAWLLLCAQGTISVYSSEKCSRLWNSELVFQRKQLGTNVQNKYPGILSGVEQTSELGFQMREMRLSNNFFFMKPKFVNLQLSNFLTAAYKQSGSTVPHLRTTSDGAVWKHSINSPKGGILEVDSNY